MKTANHNTFPFNPVFHPPPPFSATQALQQANLMAAVHAVGPGSTPSDRPLPPGHYTSDRVGVALGSGIGGIGDIADTAVSLHDPAKGCVGAFLCRPACCAGGGGGAGALAGLRTLLAPRGPELPWPAMHVACPLQVPCRRITVFRASHPVQHGSRACEHSVRAAGPKP